MKILHWAHEKRPMQPSSLWISTITDHQLSIQQRISVRWLTHHQVWNSVSQDDEPCSLIWWSSTFLITPGWLGLDRAGPIQWPPWHPGYRASTALYSPLLLIENHDYLFYTSAVVPQHQFASATDWSLCCFNEMFKCSTSHELQQFTMYR